LEKWDRNTKAITVCEQALAAQQEPYGYVSIGDHPVFRKETPEIGRWETVYTTPPAVAQPAQELQNAKKLFCEALSFGLVYRVEIGRQWDIERDKKADQLVSRLYTPAAQRPWVDLTDDEIRAMDAGMISNSSFYAGALWADAMLKEKNT
jgi:hypothetical protein